MLRTLRLPRMLRVLCMRQYVLGSCVVKERCDFRRVIVLFMMMMEAMQMMVMMMMLVIMLVMMRLY